MGDGGLRQECRERERLGELEKGREGETESLRGRERWKEGGNQIGRWRQRGKKRKGESQKREGECGGGGRNTEKGRLGELDNEREKERGRELEWWKGGKRERDKGLGKRDRDLWRDGECVGVSIHLCSKLLYVIVSIHHCAHLLFVFVYFHVAVFAQSSKTSQCLLQSLSCFTFLVLLFNRLCNISTTS